MTPEEAPLDLDGLAELARRASDGPVAHTAFIATLNPSTVLRLIDLARLGVAWQAAEETLPEGWAILRVERDFAMANDGIEQWYAAAQGAATASIESDLEDTPTAALQALAAKLREADR